MEFGENSIFTKKNGKVTKHKKMVVDDPNIWKHNESRCPSCGQRVFIRMVLNYCNQCLQESRVWSQLGGYKPSRRNTLVEVVDGEVVADDTIVGLWE